MYKWMYAMLGICLLIFTGCMQGTSDNQKVAAVVRGEEITVGALRILYPDDVLDEMLPEVIQATLAEQEVKKKNIDITTQAKEVEATYDDYPEEDVQTAQAASIRQFAEAQGEKLGMGAREFYEQYTNASAEMTAYVNAYVTNILGELDEEEDDVEDYYVHANEVLDRLVERHKEEIERRRY